MEDVLTMEKIPESGHGEVPMVHFQKHPSTNSKSIHWFWCWATGGPEASPGAQPSHTPWDQPFLANTGYTGFSSSCSLKITCFFKASLVGPICQSLAAKSFTSKLKFWMLQRCTPVLDWRSPISAAEPHIHTSNRQSLLSFTPFNVLSSAMEHSCSFSLSHQHRGHSDATAVAPPYHAWVADSPHAHMASPASRHKVPAAPQNMPRHDRPQHKCGFGHPAPGSPDAGACPIVCLASWAPLLRAAYVLTCRTAGKQLAPSEPAVPHQESTRVPGPPFPSQYCHLQLCSAGVKFKLRSGTRMHILFSWCYTLLWSHPCATGHTHILENA